MVNYFFHAIQNPMRRQVGKRSGTHHSDCTHLTMLNANHPFQANPRGLSPTAYTLFNASQQSYGLQPPQLNDKYQSAYQQYSKRSIIRQTHVHHPFPIHAYRQLIPFEYIGLQSCHLGTDGR